MDCHFFLHGNCVKGEACPFKHDEEKKAQLSERFSKVCIYFQQGYCAWGARCMYRHEAPSKMEDTIASLDGNEEEEEPSTTPEAGSKGEGGVGKIAVNEETELERMRRLVKERMSQPLKVGPNSAAAPARPTYQRAYKPPPTPQFSTPLVVAPPAPPPPRKKTEQLEPPKAVTKAEEPKVKGEAPVAEAEAPKQKVFGRAAVERAKRLGLLPEKRKEEKESGETSGSSGAGGAPAAKKRARAPIVFGATKSGSEERTSAAVAPSAKREPVAAKPEPPKKFVKTPIPAPASLDSKKPAPIVFNPAAAKAGVAPSTAAPPKPAVVTAGPVTAKPAAVAKPAAPVTKPAPTLAAAPVKSKPAPVDTKPPSADKPEIEKAAAPKATTPKLQPPTNSTAEDELLKEGGEFDDLEEPDDDDDYELEDEELNELYNAFD